MTEIIPGWAISCAKVGGQVFRKGEQVLGIFRCQEVRGSYLKPECENLFVFGFYEGFKTRDYVKSQVFFFLLDNRIVEGK